MRIPTKNLLSPKLSTFIPQINPFYTENQYVLQRWDVRPATVGRISCYSGTYVLLQWDVLTGRRKKLGHIQKKG